MVEKNLECPIAELIVVPEEIPSTPLRTQPGVHSTVTFPTQKSFFQKIKEHKQKGGISYELIGCSLLGHRLIGGEIREIRDSDLNILRDYAGMRWHRCLRCDAWLPRPMPESFSTNFLPHRAEIIVPLRGKLLRDRYVLRLIAISKFLHFIVFSLVSMLLSYYALHKGQLYDNLINLINAFRLVLGEDPHKTPTKGIVKIFYDGITASHQKVILIAMGIGFYAAVAAVETFGLWYAKRWAEYLTLLATSLFLIPEIIELSLGPTVTKVGALIINLAIILYLLFAKRLFGVRGGAKFEEQEKALDIGWGAIERVYP